MAKHLLIQHVERSYSLSRGESLTLGRSSRNDIVIADPTISRFHLEFIWKGLYPQVIDLDSTCGLYVDRKKKRKADLKKSHLIRLGSIYLAAFLVKKPPQLEEENAAIIEALSDSDEVTLFGDNGPSEIEGHIANNKSFRKLIINLEMTRRTGTLQLKTTNGQIASLVFGLGKIRGAEFKRYRDLIALQEICSFNQGTFYFTSTVNVNEANLYTSAMCYLRSLDRQNTKRSARPDPLLNSLEQEDSDEYS